MSRSLGPGARSVTSRRARPVLGQPTYKAPSYQSSFWGRFIFALFVLALAGAVGIGGGLWWSLHRPQSSSGAKVPIHVSNGDTVTTIADRLNHEGIINNALLFRLDAKIQSLSKKLKVGDYTVRRNMSIDQMVAALSVYHSKYIQVTIREGLRSEQIARILQAHGISRRQFLLEVRHPDLKLPILASKPAAASLEGYLYPNTYDVPPNYSGREFAAFMVKTLAAAITPAMRRQLAARHWTVYQALTLASIVEREARIPSERPIIASVYINRLNQNMGLFADPTVQYALGKPGNWWPQLTGGAEMHTASPYNTYVHTGLPAGPIASPGLASIRAVVYPARTSYLYFVAEGNGHHAFAQTLAQQTANICKYEHTQCG